MIKPTGITVLFDGSDFIKDSQGLMIKRESTFLWVNVKSGHQDEKTTESS